MELNNVVLETVNEAQVTGSSSVENNSTWMGWATSLVSSSISTLTNAASTAMSVIANTTASLFASNSENVEANQNEATAPSMPEVVIDISTESQAKPSFLLEQQSGENSLEAVEKAVIQILNTPDADQLRQAVALLQKCSPDELRTALMLALQQANGKELNQADMEKVESIILQRGNLSDKSIENLISGSHSSLRKHLHPHEHSGVCRRMLKTSAKIAYGAHSIVVLLYILSMMIPKANKFEENHHQEEARHVAEEILMVTWGVETIGIGASLIWKCIDKAKKNNSPA